MLLVEKAMVPHAFADALFTTLYQLCVTTAIYHCSCNKPSQAQWLKGVNLYYCSLVYESAGQFCWSRSSSADLSWASSPICGNLTDQLEAASSRIALFMSGCVLFAGWGDGGDWVRYILPPSHLVWACSLTGGKVPRVGIEKIKVSWNLSSELAHGLFWHFLLIKASYKASPDSRGSETGSIFEREELVTLHE